MLYSLEVLHDDIDCESQEDIILHSLLESFNQFKMKQTKQLGKAVAKRMKRARKRTIDLSGIIPGVGTLQKLWKYHANAIQLNNKNKQEHLLGGI